MKNKKQSRYNLNHITGICMNGTLIISDWFSFIGDQQILNKNFSFNKWRLMKIYNKYCHYLFLAFISHFTFFDDDRVWTNNTKIYYLSLIHKIDKSYINNINLNHSMNDKWKIAKAIEPHWNWSFRLFLNCYICILL